MLSALSIHLFIVLQQMVLRKPADVKALSCSRHSSHVMNVHVLSESLPTPNSCKTEHVRL